MRRNCSDDGKKTGQRTNIRILVADDFAPWRRFVSSVILPTKPGWHIVVKLDAASELVEPWKPCFKVNTSSGTD
jgi:hypothetical protein